MPPATLNRRDWIRTVFGRQPDPLPTANASEPVGGFVAVIAGRNCLAYQNSFCSTCAERCPVPGAIVIDRGMPRIEAATCTGCRVCADVCPAPVNAILVTPRRHPAISP